MKEVATLVRTYDSKKVMIMFGTHVVTGYADGSFCTIEAHGDGFQKKVGADGEVVRSSDPDKTATVSITLLVNSPSIGHFQQQYNRDRETGDGMQPLLIKDLKGGLLFSAQQAWVVNSPSRDFDIEGPDREIELDTGDATWEGENT